MNNRAVLKRLAIGAATVAAGGLALIGYAFAIKSVPAFAFGCVISMAGLQCGMNAHLAMLRGKE